MLKSESPNSSTTSLSIYQIRYWRSTTRTTWAARRLFRTSIPLRHPWYIYWMRCFSALDDPKNLLRSHVSNTVYYNIILFSYFWRTKQSCLHLHREPPSLDGIHCVHRILNNIVCFRKTRIETDSPVCMYIYMYDVNLHCSTVSNTYNILKTVYFRST